MEKKQNVPALRFQGFSGEWESHYLGMLGVTFSGLSGKTKADFGHGQARFVPYLNVFNHPIADLQETEAIEIDDKQNEVKYGDIFFTTSSETPEEVGMSSVWLGNEKNVYLNSFCFGYRPTSTLYPFFMAFLLRSSSVRKEFVFLAQGISRYNISKNKAMGIGISFPLFREQCKIGDFFQNLDKFIDGKSHKIQKLQQFRQAMLTKLFPREGAAEPELRFRGFSGKWNVEQFSKLVFIERGGSPRPIDSYITNADDGLNWVKIGDAPKYGIYITHTAEKIKPVGLSMTRQVYPGDLILSNSMSFGRPYIMAITGCIHDGWLLIRNSNKIFDLKFLYCLLGSPNVLKQYKALASGSTVNNLNKALVGSVIIQYPPMEEQKRIGKFFDQLDSYISLQQKKLERMQRLKAALLEKLFV